MHNPEDKKEFKLQKFSGILTTKKQFTQIASRMKLAAGMSSTGIMSS
jgi:hypothetical protein